MTRTVIVLCDFAILPLAAVLTQQKAAEAAYSDCFWRALPGLDDGKSDPPEGRPIDCFQTLRLGP